MKILMTGGSGYVATSLYQALKEKHAVISTNRTTLDLTNRLAVDKFFCGEYFDVVIHCAIQGGSRFKGSHEKTAYNNVIMFHNLLENKNHYGKFINIGSGAEFYEHADPYGYSKKIINSIVQEIESFYTLRIFGVFDENELTTRFIKSNVKKALNNDFMEIHQNKHMDFFYMKDFIKIVDYYLSNDNLKKEIDCVYDNKNTLFEIAHMIKKIGNFTSGIVFQDGGMAPPYIGTFENIGLCFDGLEVGISNVIEKLKCNQ
jgi:UDP-glucose 4-epimerase